MSTEYKPSIHLPNATEIPASNRQEFDGRSTAFDHNKPYSNVVVDPDTPDAFVLDLSNVNTKTLAKNSGKPPAEVFKALQPSPVKEAAVVTSVVQGVAPPMQYESNMVWGDGPPKFYMSDTASGPDFAVQATVEKSNTAPDSLKAAFNALKSLKIPFLLSGVPEKPGFTVYFEFGQLGTMAARYHAVIEEKDCIVLVYDARFEYGQQYLPPALAPEQVLNLTVAESKQSFSVASVGLQWSLGCLDFIVLLRG
jgi:hypothetical protein